MNTNRREFLGKSVVGVTVTGLGFLSGLNWLADRVWFEYVRKYIVNLRNEVMPSNRNTDMLKVSRHSSGELIAVGLPWDAGLFIQEYWFQGIPHYAIANVSSEDIEVCLAEWTGVVGQRLAGPWRLAPHKVLCREIQALATSYIGALVAVSLNQNPIHGLLKAPRPLPFPTRWDKSNRIVTLDGLNGTGDRNTNLYFIQEKLVLDSDQIISLILQIPAKIGIISFKPTRIPGGLPQASVIRAESDSLSVEERDNVLLIGEQEISAANYHEVRLRVKLPEVKAETMAVILGRLACPSGAGFSFARGLVTSP